MLLNVRARKDRGRRKVIVRLGADIANQPAIMPTQLIHHLGDPNDVVVTAANKADECFPCILFEYSYAGELWRLFPEVGVGRGPLLVELSEVGY